MVDDVMNCVDGNVLNGNSLCQKECSQDELK